MRTGIAVVLVVLAGCDTVFRLDVVPRSADAAPSVDSDIHDDASVDAPPDAPSILDCTGGSITLRPTAIVQQIWATQYPATGSHLDKISEATPDDDASYIASFADGQVDLFAHTPIASTVTIDSITVWIRARVEGSTTSVQAAPALRAKTGLTWDDQFITPTWANYSGRAFTTNPENNNLPWTVAQLNAASFGVRKSYATDTARITQVWAIVACH